MHLLGDEFEERFEIQLVLALPRVLSRHVLIEILQDVGAPQFLSDRLIAERAQSEEFFDLRLLLDRTHEQLVIILLVEQTSEVRLQLAHRAHGGPVGVGVEVHVDLVLRANEILDAGDLIGTLDAQIAEIVHAKVHDHAPDHVVPANVLAFVMKENDLLGCDFVHVLQGRACRRASSAGERLTGNGTR